MLWPRQESNLDLELRKLLYYPLYYEASFPLRKGAGVRLFYQSRCISSKYFYCNGQQYYAKKFSYCN